MTGQSNSLGTTNLEGAAFDPGFHPADTSTDFFWSNASTSSSNSNNIILYGDSGGAITTLQMQQGAGPSPNFWGPEFGLARTLFDSGDSGVMVIKASRGGGGNGFWLPNTGHMYNHLLSQIDAGLTAVQQAGHTFDVRGFLYLQGESNGGGEAAAAGARLQTLINNVQSHINAGYANAAADMYSVVGEIAASSSNANRALTTTQQLELANASEAISFIATSDLPIKRDGIHFGRDPKLEIGRRYGDAFNSRSWVEDPKRLAGYSANFGSLTAIPHPIAQGLAGGGTAAPAVALEPINDDGIPAWRMVDNNPRSSNPSYRQSLDSEGYQQMFDQGWVFRATAKVISEGGLAFWSISQDADPGWGLTEAQTMNGFELSRVNGDELEVGLILGQTAINLGPGSADKYHTFELRGTAGTSLFDFYINGALQFPGNDLTTTAGVTGFDNSMAFTSGLGAATGVEVYWNEVTLLAVPEPTTLLLFGPGLCASVLFRRGTSVQHC